MTFIFTKNHKCTVRLKEDNANIEVVNDMKLLRTIITNDLKWEWNTSYLTTKAYKSMQLLHNVAKYTKESKYLITIFVTYISPVLEQSSVVWHSSLTKEYIEGLERVQRS